MSAPAREFVELSVDASSHGASSNLWRHVRTEHGVITQRHVLGALNNRQRLLLDTRKRPVVFHTRSSGALTAAATLLRQLFVAEAQRCGSWRLSERHLLDYFARHIKRLSAAGALLLPVRPRAPLPLLLLAAAPPPLATLALADRLAWAAVARAVDESEPDAVRGALRRRARQMAERRLRCDEPRRDSEPPMLPTTLVVSALDEQRNEGLLLRAARVLLAAAADEPARVSRATQAVHVLLANGCDVNARNSIGWTLLHEASSASAGGGDRPMLLRLLLEQFAARNNRLPSVGGRRARSGTTGSIRDAAVDTLDDGAIDELLRQDAARLPAQQLFLSPLDESGWTPLHYAASCCANDAVLALLDAGAPATTLTKKYELPLHFLLRTFDAERAADTTAAVKRLIEGREWSILIADQSGASPLQVAVSHCPSAIVALLVDAAGVGRADANNQTLLHHAARAGVLETVQILLTRDEIDATARSDADTGRKTALEVALEAHASNEPLIATLRDAERKQLIALNEKRKGVSASKAVGEWVNVLESDDEENDNNNDNDNNDNNNNNDNDDNDNNIQSKVELDINSGKTAVLDAIRCKFSRDGGTAAAGNIFVCAARLECFEWARSSTPAVVIDFDAIERVTRDSKTHSIEVLLKGGSGGSVESGELIGVDWTDVPQSIVFFEIHPHDQLSAMGESVSDNVESERWKRGARELHDELKCIVSWRGSVAPLSRALLASARWPSLQRQFASLAGEERALLKLRSACELTMHGRTVRGVLLVGESAMAFVQLSREPNAFARAVRFDAIKDLSVVRDRESPVSRGLFGVRRSRSHTTTAVGGDTRHLAASAPAQVKHLASASEQHVARSKDDLHDSMMQHQQPPNVTGESTDDAAQGGETHVLYDGHEPASMWCSFVRGGARWHLSGLKRAFCEQVLTLHGGSQLTSSAGSSSVLSSSGSASAPFAVVADALSPLGVAIVSALVAAGLRVTALVGAVGARVVDSGSALAWQLRAHGARLATIEWRESNVGGGGRRRANDALWNDSSSVLDDGYAGVLMVSEKDEALLRRDLARADMLVLCNALEGMNGAVDVKATVQHWLANYCDRQRLQHIVKVSPMRAKATRHESAAAAAVDDDDLLRLHERTEQWLRKAWPDARVDVVQHAPSMACFLRHASCSVNSRLELSIAWARETAVALVHVRDIGDVVARAAAAAAAASGGGGGSGRVWRVRGPEWWTTERLAATLQAVCDIERVKVAPCDDDEWLAMLIGGDRHVRAADELSARRLARVYRQWNEWRIVPAAANGDDDGDDEWIVGRVSLVQYLEADGRKVCSPKRRNYFRAQDTLEMRELFASLCGEEADGRPVLTFDAFRAHFSVLLDDDALVRVLFAAFERLEGGARVSFESWIAVWSVLCLGDTFERLDLAWQLMASDGGERCARDDVERLAEGVHGALRRTGLNMLEASAWSKRVWKRLAARGEWASRREFVRASLAGDERQQELSLAALVARRMPALGKRRSLRAVPLMPGGEQWSIVAHVLLGVFRSLGETASRADSDTLLDGKSDVELCGEQRTLSLGRDVRGWNGDTYRCDFHVTTFAPMLFFRLRQLDGVDGALRRSLSPVQLIDDVFERGAWSGLLASASSGRSGSIFWQTADGFVLKTLPTMEEVLLRRILPMYVAHLCDARRRASAHPRICIDSLLTRFCGLFRLKSLHHTVCFAIMKSVFGQPVDVQYDLKGSSINRSVGADADPQVARKDSDFGEQRRVRLGAQRRAIVMAQIERDVMFLEQFHLCDYSLLLGVRRRRLDDRVASEAHGILKCGGWLSECGTEVYYFAIIDVLTQFNLKKKGELLAKSIRFDSSKISANPPAPYRKRFLRFLSRIIV